MSDKQFLDTPAASAFLTSLGFEFAPQTLKNMRSRAGAGPRYVKVAGKVRYRRADLERYLEQHVVDPAKVA